MKRIFYTAVSSALCLLLLLCGIPEPITSSADTTFQRSLPDMPVGIQAEFDKYMSMDNTVIFIYYNSYKNNDEYYIHIYQSESSVDDLRCVLSGYNPYYSSLGYETIFLFYNSENNSKNFNLLYTIGYKFSTNSWSKNDIQKDYVNNERVYYCEYGLSNGTPEQVTANILYSSVDISCIYYDNVIRPANSGYNQFEVGGYTFSGSGITGGDIDKIDENSPNFVGPHEYNDNFKVISRDFKYSEFLQWCIDNEKYIGLFNVLGVETTVENQKKVITNFLKCWYNLNSSDFISKIKYLEDYYELITAVKDIVSVDTFLSKAQNIYSYFNKCLEEYKATLTYIVTEPDYENLENIAEEAETTSTETGILYWIKNIYKTLRNVPSSTATFIQNRFSDFVYNVETDLSSLSLNLITYSKNFNEVFAKLPENISAAFTKNLGVINDNIKNHDDFTNNDLTAITNAIASSGNSATLTGGLTAADIDNVLGGFLGVSPSGVFGAGGVITNALGGISDGISLLNTRFDFGDSTYSNHISSIDSGITDLKNIISGGGSVGTGGADCGYSEESFFVKLHDEIEYWVVPQEIPEEQEISTLFAEKFGFIVEIRNAASYVYDIADCNVTVNSEIDTNDNLGNFISYGSSSSSDTGYTAVETLSLNSDNFNYNTVSVDGNKYPDTTFNVKSDLLGVDFKAQLVDFSIYDKVKPLVDTLIVGIIWGLYLFKLFSRIPGFVKGYYFSRKSEGGDDK